MTQRRRWPGFWLGDGPRDQVIAEWLDGPGRQINVSRLVKDFLYQVATSQALPDPTAQAVIAALRADLADLRRDLSSGARLPIEQTADDDIEGADEIIRRLGSMED